MARYKLPSCVFVDQSGNVVEDGTCSIYKAGTTTAADVYAASSGGSAVNSVTSSSAGQCTWYVDTGDYATSQKFKVTFSKTNFTPQTYDDVVVFPEVTLTGTETLTNKTLTTPTITDLTNMIHPHMTVAGGGLIGKFEEKRAKFTHVDDENITISAAQYYCVDKFCWWDAALTSTNVAAATSDWVYLYLDYSAITSGTEITNAELIWSTTEPTWTEANRAWMNGSDRCIFAVRTDGSDDILEFYHAGDFVVYADEIEDHADATITNSWVDLTLTAPKFCTKVEIMVGWTFAVASSAIYWRTNGQTGSTGHWMGYVETGVTRAYNTIPVITDINQAIEKTESNAAPNCTLQVLTQGWYFPIGM